MPTRTKAKPAPKTKYRAPRIARREILGFYGKDKRAAWDEAHRLSELLCKTDSTGRMGIRPENQRGEWVVMVVHYADPEPGEAFPERGRATWTDA